MFLLPSLLVLAAAPPDAGEPHPPFETCLRGGERLERCERETVQWTEREATDVYFCDVTGSRLGRPRFGALVEQGKLLACLGVKWPVPLEETWSVSKDALAADNLAPSHRVVVSKRFPAQRLLMFFGPAFASDFNEVEVFQVQHGKAVQVFEPAQVSGPALLDLDGDAMPELLGATGGCQSMCCYSPTAVYRNAGGKFRLDPAAMEQLARKNKQPWAGPVPADGDEKNAVVKACQDKLREAVEREERKAQKK